MLIQRAPDAYEKLQVLGGMAGDDVLAPSTTEKRLPASRPPSPANHQGQPGIYRAAMPGGKFISLMRVMFTDFCMMDCAYCPNSVYVPRKRFAFKVDELVRLFMTLADRHQVQGLFLSSGIAGSPDKTNDKMVQVVDAIRNRYKFRGYIHLKVMPGAGREYVEAAHRLGTRLSVNIETPSAEALRRISPHKEFHGGILDPMAWIKAMTQESYGGTVGQATQMVVGAADESDSAIYERMVDLYVDLGLKRVYYQAFRPARFTPLEEHPATPPIREHRLYQLDWLHRVYRLPRSEIELAFDSAGFLDLETDPKMAIALEQVDRFPVDVNTASREELLRVPGVGPLAAERIVQRRREHRVEAWGQLRTLGVVTKRAEPFLVLPGHRPTPAKQGLLPLWEARKEQRERTAGQSASRLPLPSGSAPCGLRGSCAGCALAGVHGMAAPMPQALTAGPATTPARA
ncbi:MAG: helix-hairpin-helix domain-containing protein [Chloroflexi bacterium]|nr:helix-hairpin-helix domain-containing protein [Chloroflexota bacterium]